MHQAILDKARACFIRNRNRRRFHRLILAIGCVVVFLTTYALILPAITLEQESFCGLEEHTHTEACFRQATGRLFVCTSAQLSIHSHSTECYNDAGALICGQADYVAHSHNEDCYDTEGKLVCTLEERSTHVHSDACYSTAETEAPVLHVHSEACSTLVKGSLKCEREEYEGHVHVDTCYVPGQELLCTITENHVHGEACYTYPLTCTLSTDPHTHSSCYGTGSLLCTTVEGHVHTDSCRETRLTCESTEEGHEHGDACYTQVTVCTIPENHSHSSSCYEPVLTCGKAEGEAHVHGTGCYSTETSLICTLEENHVHNSSCYRPELHCQIPEDPGHSHNDDCYEWESVISCGLTEGEPEPTEAAEPVLTCTEPVARIHVHDENCFETVFAESDPICGNTDLDHVHTLDCYTAVCGLEEHTHSLACYSDPEADVESQATWEATMANVTLTGDWHKDVVAIAESQLGYTESTRNYAVWEDNTIHGYTRYGAWYGVPYGDWCGMFVSFCLNYAGVEDMPLNYGVRPWIEDLTTLGLYHSAVDHAPIPGEIIFYDWEGDGLADHVGIVAEVTEATEHTGASIKAIEGNSSNCVQYVSYTADDPVILGYAMLPEKQIPVITKTAAIYTDSSYTVPAEDTTVITLSGYIPEDAEVRAYPVIPESELDILCAYDISIFLPDGTLYQPANGEVVNVTIQSPELETAEENLTVYHIPEEGSPAPVETDVSGGTVSFDAEHFSVYAVTRSASFTVSFDPAISATYEEIEYTAARYETFCALKFTVNDNNWSNVTVTITSDAFTDGTDAVVYEVTEWGESRISSESDPDSISFTVGGWELRTHTYAVLLPPESVSSMTLTEDLIISEKMFVTKDVNIDLNGYTIRPADGYTDAIFEVTETGSLTITDSQAGQGNGHSLTYTVMESTVINSTTGQTSESDKTYTFSASGGIQAGEGPVIRVSGGTVNIEGGMIYGGTGRAVEASDGSTVNLSGGYIYDFDGVDQGGAISISGGSLNISGDAVIANNHASVYGGGIYVQDCTVTMTGGVISGNNVAYEDTYNGASGSDAGNAQYGGGGIAVQNCTFNLSGGYVTKNTSLAGGYWGGGGGILCRGSTALNLSGGYVTGNQANAGGGIKTIDYIDGSATVTMSGGYVCGNYATYGEGGGIAIGGGDQAYITAGYINNNRTDSPVDWGGGGLFVANDASLYIERALVTENTAGGFGAGIAGCSTARMHISITEGGAVYNNHAQGQNVSGGGSTKHEDTVYAKNSAVFMSNGYQDIFSALNCTVEGGMLGGSPALWTGSCDGEAVTSDNADDLIHSENVLGLTARADADSTALQQARLYITGNHSNTHGGGILCNGYMVMGTPREAKMIVGARIAVSAGKNYLDQNGESLAFPTASPFTFVIEKEDGTVITTGTANEAGEIIFTGRIPFSNEGTYTYYIREVPGNDPTVVYDQTRYRLTVTVSLSRISNPASSIETWQCCIDAITVDRQEPDSETWETCIETFDPGDTENGAISLNLGDSFVNYRDETVQETGMTVIKVWNCDASVIPDAISVTLMQNGEAYPSETASVSLSAANNWSHTWTELPAADDKGNAFSYTVQEEDLADFDAEYETTSENGIIQTTITNTLKTYSLDISKRSNHATPVALEGAVFQLEDAQGQILSFVSDPETGIHCPAAASEKTASAELMTDAEGSLQITGLPAGTYILMETQAPYGFQLAAPVTVTLGGESMEEDRTMELTVVDKLMEYELPETGGSGTYLYTAGGLLLMAVALLLLYNNTVKRRKGEFVSS